MKFGIFYEHQLPRPWGPDSEYRLLQDSLTQIELADRLRRIADPDDTVARLGGDEFAVLMPRADHAHALEFAHRCAIVLSAPWKDCGVTIDPRVSIGIAVAHGTGTDGESLLRQADTAMYEAKRAGRDRIARDRLGDQPPGGAARITTRRSAAGAQRARRAAECSG